MKTVKLLTFIFFTGFAFAIDYFCTIVVFFFFFSSFFPYGSCLCGDFSIGSSKPYHTDLSHDEHQPKTNVPKEIIGKGAGVMMITFF